ncbi:MAG: tryptophan-rich sensory protein [Sedimentisphaerales bacterium]|nr:tryptophan-rich sensory protein [Sedimentisphaerales bacterium]
MKSFKYIRLILSFALPFSAILIASLFSGPPGQWYESLNKPPFNPPGWIFGPAWTILYLMMGIAFFLVWQKGLKIKDVKIALTLFLIQLTFNAAWMPIFFGYQKIFIAFIDIILLWFAILLTIIKFWNISKTASILLIPYILWVTFASVINLSIWILNS